MKLGKYEVKIVFRFQSCWIGVYPNELKGKLCIAFLPFCILRVIDKEKHWQCENEMLKGALKCALGLLPTKQFGDSNNTYDVEHLLQVINNDTVGN